MASRIKQNINKGVSAQNPKLSAVPVTTRRPVSNKRVTPSFPNTLPNLSENKIYIGEIQKKINELPSIDITGTSLGSLTGENLKKIGIKITTHEDDGRSGSLSDARLGVSNFHEKCGTCGGNENTCPANHLGYIQLSAPMFHPLQYRRVIALLNSICWDCAGIYMDKNEYERRGLSRIHPSRILQLLEKLSEKKICGRGKSLPKGCDLNLPKCSSSDIRFKIKDYPYYDRVYYEKTGEKGEKKEAFFDIKDVKDRFSCISKEDLVMLGFHGDETPSGWIIDYLPVISPAMRPSSVVDGEVKHDMITTVYQKIIKANNDIDKAKIGIEERSKPRQITRGRNKGDYKSPERELDEKKKELFHSVKVLIQGDDKKLSNGLNDFISFSQRIQGKDGMIRNNMMGKRGGHAGRSVITPDPTLKFGQIRIPEDMANILTVPILVTETNLKYCIELLRSGKVNNITDLEDKFIRVDEERKMTRNLLLGETIHRQLQDGDWVVANRQPTLHRYGMMGFQAKISKERSIGMHMSVVTAFNADFDGDEMNIYVPQGEEAILEVAVRMNVKNCIMNAQSNKPIIGLVYDSITGARELSKPDTLIHPEDYNDAITLIEGIEDLVDLDERLERYGIRKVETNVGGTKTVMYPGRALFSALLPSTFFYNKGDVIIREGVLIQGLITKEHISTTHHSIIQEMWKDYGYERTSIFISDANLVINRYFQTTGFSVGLDDCLPEGEDIKTIIANNIREVFNGFKILYLKPDEKVTSFTDEDLQNVLEEVGDTNLTEIDIIMEKIISDINNIQGEEVELAIDKFIVKGLTELTEYVPVSEQFYSLSDNLRDRISLIKDKDYRMNINRIIDRSLVEIQALGTTFIDPIKEERRESNIKAIAQKMRGQIEDLTLEKVSEYNNFRAMASSGAKGDKFNLGQIVGILGLQLIKGERLKRTITESSRCLPYFLPGDDDIFAMGFCKRGYVNGLSPGEYFYANASGRVGLLDLATKTAETGSMHHKMMKNLEDVRIYEDGTVRNGSTDRIIQFVYGNDGFDSAHLINVKSNEGVVTNFIDWQHEFDRRTTEAGFIV